MEALLCFFNEMKWSLKGDLFQVVCCNLFEAYLDVIVS